MTAPRKHSRKRDEILRVLRATKSHPDAAWIYDQLRLSIPDLSLGTVYRNLALFKQSGDILSVGVFDGVEHFDGDTRDHAHFVCRSCGRILDLPDLGAALSREAQAHLDAAVERCEVVCYGLCDVCRKRT